MQLEQDLDRDGYTIVAYEPGVVQVNVERVRASCLVAPDRLVRDWPPRSLEELRPEHLVAVTEFDPEMVLLPHLQPAQGRRPPGGGCPADRLIQGAGPGERRAARMRGQDGPIPH
jgi:hypothetical protein